MLYVEGGGDRNPSLASECRKAFSELFEKAGIKQKPKVVACGSRKHAYDMFRDAHDAGDSEVWLLVDAEDPPSLERSPWDHVKTRKGDGWERPTRASDDQLHLMTICMETWLLTDHDALKKIFGPKFDEKKLPAISQLENTEKQAIHDALKEATRPTPAGKYGKGTHSFRILALVSPENLRNLVWGKRFLDAMEAAQ
jgi:hypothetical protein